MRTKEKEIQKTSIKKILILAIRIKSLIEVKAYKKADRKNNKEVKNPYNKKKKMKRSEKQKRRKI